ncbi:Fic family protein [Mangrovibacillus cuniculi]|uniref:Fic family protein n=1 Tax=Mangrovibacillus cuniculi TaxID=2593652 RepID=A0A7S8CCU8_9BACI|nr:Fic family protein [Mangrovibacillus cuniculi]QPC47640.1 Fic family protein [Mangrovibacillus cuniculi]
MTLFAQFESIHPFLDGNGRLGRILIALYLLQTKIIETPFFFLSEELEKEKFRYYSMLNGVRGIGKKEPDWASWITFFLDTAERMAKHQFAKLDEAENLYEGGLQSFEQPSIAKVWGAMFEVPIATVPQLEKITGLAQGTIRKSLSYLVEKNMIFTDERIRHKRYYHYDLIRIMTE